MDKCALTEVYLSWNLHLKKLTGGSNILPSLGTNDLVYP